jgi:hypothetical protein
MVPFVELSQTIFRVFIQQPIITQKERAFVLRKAHVLLAGSTGEAVPQIL